MNNKKKIVIINGSGGSGKDTFIEICSTMTDIMNVSAIDPAKNCLKYLVGVDYIEGETEKTELLRKLLSDLKQLSIHYNNYPITYIKEKAKEFMESNKSILFIHCREIPEIIKLTNELAIVTGIKPYSLIVTSTRVPEIVSNNSDKFVNLYTYDYMIKNDKAIEDLEEAAKDFVKNI